MSLDFSRSHAVPYERALVVGDRNGLCQMLRRHLRAHGVAVDVAPTTTEAEARIASRTPDVVILVGDLGGLTAKFVRALRGCYRVPVLVVSDDPVSAAPLFEAGADDVVRYPVPVDELTARVRALVRRSLGTVTLLNQEIRRGVLLDTGHRCLVIGERCVSLTVGEYRLLLGMLRQPIGCVCSTPDLYAAVYGSSFAANGDALRAVVKRLRAKLGPYRDLISAERAHGYYFGEPGVTRDSVEVVARGG